MGRGADRLGRRLVHGRGYPTSVIEGRVLQALERSGALARRRGHVSIAQKGVLRAASCNCDDSVRRHFDAVLTGAYPAGVEMEDATV